MSCLTCGVAVAVSVRKGTSGRTLRNFPRFLRFAIKQNIRIIKIRKKLIFIIFYITDMTS